MPTKRTTFSRKSILKRPSAEEEQEEEEDEDESLFALLLPSGTAVALIVSDWRAKYAADPTAALAELYTLVARVSSRGCRPVCTPRVFSCFAFSQQFQIFVRGVPGCTLWFLVVCEKKSIH